MQKNIIFLPFINGKESKDWRDDRQKDFFKLDGMERLTNDINEARSKKPVKKKYGDSESEVQRYETDIRTYYNDLHALKAKRQAVWVKYLAEETAKLFENELKKMLKRPDFKDSIIVAALPEFFWCDINDNQKHIPSSAEHNEEEIIGYHKPLYDTNMINILLHAENNPLARLTKTCENLIIFAGTVMWKIINEENHENEMIDNTLIIYHSGDVADTWSKHFVSTIDGFYKYVRSEENPGKWVCKLVKNKKGEYGTKNERAPITEFKGVKFTYDICLDFVKGTNGRPLSTDLCNGQKTDMNVLISAGMPIYDIDLTKINSPVILRCDGSYPPYAEIAQNGVYLAGSHNSISGGTIIGELETVIDIPKS